MMARPLRIEYPGAIYHVTARGNARADIYLDDQDRNTFLKILGQVCDRFNWCCYGYCLMTNHYHLVIETPEGNLSKGMRQLNGVYTQTFNRTHQHVGHVFQGRYKAILVEKDSYLLEVIRYVMLNPVRAHMTQTAGQYPWSSYRAMIGKVPTPDWLSKEWVLSQFGNRESTARKYFIEFVKAGSKKADLWDNLRHQIYLGDEHFIKNMQPHLEEKDLSEIPRKQHRINDKPLAYYINKYKNRDKAIIAAYNTGVFTQIELSRFFKLHYSSISKILKRQTTG